MPVPVQADVVVPVRAVVDGGKVEMSRFCTPFRNFKFHASFVPVRPAAELG